MHTEEDMDLINEGEVEMNTTNAGYMDMEMEFGMDVTISKTKHVNEPKESMDLCPNSNDVLMDATTSEEHRKSLKNYLDPTENDSLYLDAWNRLIGRIKQKKEEL
jgi:hypothetical protein